MEYINHINYINNIKSDKPPPFSYVSLDTKEGSDCVGHWFCECAIFLPYIKELSKNTTTPLKILFHNRKEYKVKLLADFGFYESDIAYSLNMVPFGNNIQYFKEYHTRVHPSEEEYSLYVPQFYHLSDINNNPDNNIVFLEHISNLRNYYIDSLPNITKTIPISYVPRSRKENYQMNKRNFDNMDDFCRLLNKYNVNIIDIDNLESFKAQFEIILRTKVLIVEMNSAWFINAATIATDSHIIVFNDFFARMAPNIFYTDGKDLIKSHNNTHEIFSTSAYIHNPFSVDLQAFEQRLIDITSKN